MIHQKPLVSFVIEKLKKFVSNYLIYYVKNGLYVMRKNVVWVYDE